MVPSDSDSDSGSFHSARSLSDISDGAITLPPWMQAPVLVDDSPWLSASRRRRRRKPAESAQVVPLTAAMVAAVESASATSQDTSRSGARTVVGAELATAPARKKRRGGKRQPQKRERQRIKAAKRVQTVVRGWLARRQTLRLRQAVDVDARLARKMEIGRALAKQLALSTCRRVRGESSLAYWCVLCGFHGVLNKRQQQRLNESGVDTFELCRVCFDQRYPGTDRAPGYHVRCKCGDTYTYANHLYLHIKNVSGRRPTLCPKCHQRSPGWHHSFCEPPPRPVTPFGRAIYAVRIQMAARALLARRERAQRRRERAASITDMASRTLNPYAREFTPRIQLETTHDGGRDTSHARCTATRVLAERHAPGDDAAAANDGRGVSNARPAPAPVARFPPSHEPTDIPSYPV